MKRLIHASAVGLALLLAGCQGEAEEAPAITEAIPLNTDEGPAGIAGEASDEAGDAVSGDTPSLPGAASGQEASGEGSLPDSMETGSNPPDMTEPPKGSKVQRVN